MENLHKRSGKHLYLIILVLIVICSSSCSGLKENTAEATTINSIRNDIIDEKTSLPKKIVTQAPEAISNGDQQRRRELPVISIDNASDLILQEKIYPFFPEIVHIASGGRIAAVGDLSGIKIIDLDSGIVLMQVDATLPVCNFGMGRYFQLNYDGAFLAVATYKAVQVWQVGGGIVYEALYDNNHTLDSSVCGADIPQMALSPDGMLLAVSGMRFSATEVESYFRVVDIIKNTTVFERDGKSESPKGQFYTFPGLGFSSDGKVLQIFDPSRLNNNGDSFHTAFRFWSTENWTPLSGNSTWWTHTNYLAGFQVIDENTISFIPQVADYRNQMHPQYSGSCQIHSDDFAIECGVTLSFQDSITVTLVKKEGGVAIIDTTSGNDKLIAEIKIPTNDPGDSWQFRLLDYVWETGTLLFCLDRNLRVETCVIMDFPNNEIFYEQIDLEGLLYSRKNSTVAFINKEEKSLYLINDDTDTIKKMRTYQAVSLPIKPAFLSGGSELVYMVQSLGESENTYFERIDTNLGKVIRRYDIDGLQAKEISSISVSGKEELWAASDIFGNVFIIDPEEEAVIHIFRGAEEEITDMIFNPDGKTLLMMGKSGRIQIWGVGE